MLGGATAGMQAVKCRDLHRYRVEALNLYKSQCARQKPREDTLAVQGATSLHIPHSTCLPCVTSGRGHGTRMGECVHTAQQSRHQANFYKRIDLQTLVREDFTIFT